MVASIVPPNDDYDGDDYDDDDDQSGGPVWDDPPEWAVEDL